MEMSPATVLMVSVFIHDGQQICFTTSIKDDNLFIENLLSPNTSLHEGDQLLVIDRLVVGCQISSKEAEQKLKEAKFKIDIVIASAYSTTDIHPSQNLYLDTTAEHDIYQLHNDPGPVNLVSSHPDSHNSGQSRGFVSSQGMDSINHATVSPR